MELGPGNENGKRIILNLPPSLRGVFSQASHSDPAVLFSWDMDMVTQAADWINQNPEVPLPEWFTAARPVAPSVFQYQLLRYISPAGRILGSVAIAPNSLVQFFQLCDGMAHLCSDPFMVQACGEGRAPLATTFFIDDGKKPVTATHSPPAPVIPGAARVVLWN